MLFDKPVSQKPVRHGPTSQTHAFSSYWYHCRTYDSRRRQALYLNFLSNQMVTADVWSVAGRRTQVYTHTHDMWNILFFMFFVCVLWVGMVYFLSSAVSVYVVEHPREHCKMSHLYTTTANILCSWRIFFIHRHQAAPHRCRMKSEGRERSRKQLKILLYMHKLRDNL